jgi:hypothetical protein
MELDELKDIWKKTDGDFKPKAESELAVMLRGNSKSIVAKLKRSVWFELIFTLVAGFILLMYALRLPAGALKWIAVSILILFVVYSFYYVKKIMLLNRFTAENNLKVNLEKLIHNLYDYLRFYKRSYALLYPIYFCLALVFVAIERGFNEFLGLLFKPQTIAYLTLLAGLFFFCSTWFVNWCLKKLYGRHLEKLEALLNELNGNEKPAEASELS